MDDSNKSSFFDQNESLGGFQTGGYDEFAECPVTSNWTRQSKFRGIQKPYVKWKVPYKHNEGSSSIIIGRNGVIYYGTGEGTLYAVDRSGKILWKFQAKDPLCTPTISRDGTIIVGSIGDWESENQYLYAINPDGTQKWSYLIDDSIESSIAPVIDHEGNIYVVTDGFKLIALSENGEFKWEIKRPVSIWLTPIIINTGNIITSSFDNMMFSLNSDGTEQWSVPIDQYTIGTLPVIDSNGSIFVNVNLNLEDRMRLVAFNLDGTIQSVFTLPEGDIWTGPALGNNGILYVGANYFRLVAIDPIKGIQWEAQLDGFIHYPPIIDSDGVIYVCTTKEVREKHETWLYAMNPDGTQKWLFKVKGEGEDFALGSNGTIYLKTYEENKGHLYAIGDKSKK